MLATTYKIGTFTGGLRSSQDCSLFFWSFFWSPSYVFICCQDHRVTQRRNLHFRNWCFCIQCLVRNITSRSRVCSQGTTHCNKLQSFVSLFLPLPWSDELHNLLGKPNLFLNPSVGLVPGELLGGQRSWQMERESGRALGSAVERAFSPAFTTFKARGSLLQRRASIVQSCT